MRAEPLLVVENLNVSFRTARGLLPIVEDLSFAIAKGEIFAIVGESGSGKSLTALALMRLITDPNAVLSGRIAFAGRDILALPPREMRRLRGAGMAMIFQDPMSALTPVHKVGAQIVEQILVHQKISNRAARSRAVELLGAMGIPAPESVARRFPHELSGGMRHGAVVRSGAADRR
jgi:peptide/nickel transport system ATP-binding protein